MDSVDLIARLHRHRDWSNRQLLDVAEQLSRDQLHQTFEMGQETIWKSLTHLYGAEYIWLEALMGNDDPVAPGDVHGKLPGNQEGDNPIADVAQLRDRWNELNARWTKYLADLSPGDLDQTIHKFSSLSGKRSGTRCSDILLHVCTHAQYTTAQAINMMRHVGVATLPDPMLITLAREEASTTR